MPHKLNSFEGERNHGTPTFYQREAIPEITVRHIQANKTWRKTLFPCSIKWLLTTANDGNSTFATAAFSAPKTTFSGQIIGC
ncbi:hypothetical protein QSV34_08485 [Porticoccus sp. W117]|uniref:hypothetical protein n=1 Tax=Porticoccus sp. W117 TaxID=3054777 RepID=UPI002594256E|nr:hypothetical protein [Porticoccus sp. W117]MDM3871390.1 hypothetical protein [Porticoccus sp. W117]